MDAAKDLLITILSFVTVLSLVVFVHEFGHFQAARWLKVAVKSFSIGMGPEWFGWTDKHKTRWKVSTIPLGGFVSWVDDTDPSSTAPATKEHQELSKEEARRRGHFRAAPLSTRAIVTAAGPLSNFIFAIAAFAALAMIFGRDATDYSKVTPRIGGVLENSAAAEAGLRPGEIVVAVDGAPIAEWGAFQNIIFQSAGRPLTLTLSDDGATRTVVVTPRVEERLRPDGVTERVAQLGVGLNPLPGERIIEAVNPMQAVGIGASQTWALVVQTWNYVSGMVTGQNSGRDIAGPLGIFTASGQVAQDALSTPADQSHGGPLGMLALSLLGWAAMLSVAVGIVNLLPIPVLDGGHLLFYSVEAIRGGKPLPAVAQEWAFRAGLAVMASLFLFATWNDVTRHLGSQG
jgi:regulator of sigma E protease